MATPKPLERPATSTSAQPSSPLVGTSVALVGCVLVVAAWLTPVIGSEPSLLAQAHESDLRWFWEFLVPLGVVVLAASFSVWAMLTGSQWSIGAIVGVGLAGAAYFAMYVGAAVSGFLIGAGSLIGLVGAGLIVGGGYAARGPEEEFGIRKLWGGVALLGAVLVVSACFLPTGGLRPSKGPGSLVAPGGVPIQYWLIPLLQPLLLVVITVAVAGRSFLQPVDRLMVGVMIGCGLMQFLFFVALLGIGDQNMAGILPIGAWVGLLGISVIIVSGIMSLRQPMTPAWDDS